MTLAEVGSATTRLRERLESAVDLNDSLGAALLFALQASLCSLATLWIAMWLQLDSPYWAASTVLITAQATRFAEPVEGDQSHPLGTLIGLVASLVIVALFPPGLVVPSPWRSAAGSRSAPSSPACCARCRPMPPRCRAIPR